MEIPPLQSPHPPLWYGSSNTVGAHWAGEHGLHFSTNGAIDCAKGNLVAFREALAERGGPAVPKPEFPGGTVIGINRAVVVAETDQKARPCAHLNQN